MAREPRKLSFSPKSVQKSAQSVPRPKLLDHVQTREELLWRAGEVFQWIAEGKLKVTIDREFGLNEVGKGHAYIEAGQTTGKVVFNCEKLG